jgi:hypothetical protein
MATHDPNDVVRAATGSLVAIETYQRELREAGIDSKVVGLDLKAGLGTALLDSIELWVHRSDAERAAAVIDRVEKERGRPRVEGEEHGHPTSDPKQPRQGGRPHTHYDADPHG